MAEETARLLDGEGTLVVVSSGSRADGVEEDQTAWVRYLQEAIRAYPGLSIEAVEKTEPPEDQIDLAERTLAFDDLRRVIKNHPGATAVISLVGEPEVTVAMSDELPLSRPRLICVCGVGSPRLERMVEGGVVDLAFVERDEPQRGPAVEEGERAWFDKYYELLRATR
jgi:hypothetical protein